MLLYQFGKPAVVHSIAVITTITFGCDVHLDLFNKAFISCFIIVGNLEQYMDTYSSYQFYQCQKLNNACSIIQA